MPVAHKFNLVADHNGEATAVRIALDYSVGLFAFEAVLVDCWVNYFVEANFAVGHIINRLKRQNAIVGEHDLAFNERVAVLNLYRPVCGPAKVQDTRLLLRHVFNGLKKVNIIQRVKHSLRCGKSHAIGIGCVTPK